MAAYIILDINVRDAAQFEAYQQGAPATVAQYGGRYLVRGGQHETLEGNWHPTRLVVLEFPSAEAARRWYESEAYEKVKPLRRQRARSDIVLVTGI